MAVEFVVEGTTVGFERPLVLIGVVVGLLVVGALVLRPGLGSISRRKRGLLFASRALVVILLVVGAAGPYTVATETTTGDPHVTLLADRSASMGVGDDPTGRLATAIEQRGVSVTTRSVGDTTGSPVGDAVASSLSPNGTVVVVSDGRVTEGQSLDAAAELATQVNATVSAIQPEVTETERFVTVNGPSKVSAGVENTYLVAVDGVALNDSEATLTVSVDGTEVESRTVSDAASFEFSRTFNDTGSHRITATLDGEDRYERNGVFRKSVRVVEQPRILYVSRGSYPLSSYLSSLYTVERAESVPDDLSSYYAVVTQDVAAPDLGNQTALQQAVVDGTGLVVVGGPNAYEHGGYSEAVVGDLVPVRQGDPGSRSSIVIVVDISASAKEGLALQQRLALDVLDQLGDENQVGVVAFNTRAYSIAEPRPLGGNRPYLEDRIRRLQTTGSTRIASGLDGGSEMLGDGGGTVILLSDGRDKRGGAVAAATELGNQGTEVVAIGVGSQRNESLLRQIADASDGTYLQADQTSRLRLRYGGPDRRFRGSGLTVVDGSHFITDGVEFTASPGQAHEVTVKDRGDFLVASGDGRPAVSAWNYGLGRVVSITAYSSDGTLGGLLSRPDSLATTKSVNWAIGDPQRLATGVTDVPDTRVGSTTTVQYRGQDKPTAANVTFTAAGESRYQGTLVPTERGYQSVLGAEYAVNYPIEYAGFGPSPELRTAAETTGGRVFSPSSAAEIATFAREQATRPRTVQTDWSWLPLAAALVLFLLEVSARRLDEIYAWSGGTSP
ncbi:VWA domain-containing protein [Haloarcula pelagica]|uniref:VWA domain-containing protein n=1 Tax=Haloarcula pelagica TaxID=3033389 RepID=UPI0024C446BD|nr:VWA domain-containing protein [Halomicroarcula sp. YJ-61-S]